MKSNSESAKGFTLVEMLVVIAIIGILLALLLPILSRAKERASSTQYQNNLKQIGVAMRMYLDANGTWPNYPYYLGEFSQKYFSATVAEPPTNSSIWYCPSWKDGLRADPVGSYWLNLNGSGDVKVIGIRERLSDKPLGISKESGRLAGESRKSSTRRT